MVVWRLLVEAGGGLWMALVAEADPAEGWRRVEAALAAPGQAPLLEELENTGVPIGGPARLLELRRLRAGSGAPPAA